MKHGKKALGARAELNRAMTTPTAGESLDRSLARAVAWNAAARWTSQIISWICTIIVARILTPYDYGLIGMAGLYVNLATMVSQTGIGDAVIALRNLTHHQIAELNTVALLMGTVLVGISSVIAVPLAHFFSAPPLSAIIIVASATYLISAFQVVPRALLRKELRFRLLASIETVRAFSQIIITVVLAWLGFRYWSLVLGTIASAAVVTLITLFWKRHNFALPSFMQLRRELKFTSHVLLSGFAWYVYENADFGVAGRGLGEKPLGNYTVAWTISSAPVEKITNLITGVTPAYFSAVQTKKDELRRYLLRLTEIMALFTVPASVGLALTADLLVPLLLGPKWYGVIGPLRLLGVFIAARSLTTILPNLLTAIGDARFVMWNMILCVIIMPAAFFVGSRWGINGIAAAWLIAYPPLTVPMYWRVFRKTEMKTSDYASAVLPAASASIIMAAVVLFVRSALPLGSDRVALLLIVIAAGALSYAGALLTLYHDRMIGLVRIIKKLWQQQSVTPQPLISDAQAIGRKTEPVIALSTNRPN
jgi:O-antigen/teichoic acid export membrane protein